ATPPHAPTPASPTPAPAGDGVHPPARRPPRSPPAARARSSSSIRSAVSPVPPSRRDGARLVRAAELLRVPLPRGPVPDLHAVPDAEHHGLPADARGLAEPERDREPPLSVGRDALGGAEEDAGVRAAL